MKRAVLSVGLTFAMLVSTSLVSVAAPLHEPHKGTSCPDGYIGTWHFVNNQTGGEQERGVLRAYFDDGIAVVGASKVNRNVQHFYVVGYGQTLLNARTNLDGRLVLSDFDCERDKKPG